MEISSRLGDAKRQSKGSIGAGFLSFTRRDRAKDPFIYPPGADPS